MAITDFNEQLLRRLDTIDRNISTIIQSTAMNGATLTSVQSEMKDYRETNHTRFNEIHDQFHEGEDRLDNHEKRLSQIETQAHFLYKMAMIFGALLLTIVGWFTEAFHKIGTLFLSK